MLPGRRDDSPYKSLMDDPYVCLLGAFILGCAENA